MNRLGNLTLAIVCTTLACTTSRGQAPATDGHGDPLPPGALARLGTTRFRHDATVVFAAFLPGDRSVLSASSDGVICAWEFPSGKLTRRLEAHGATERPASFRLTGATLSPDGKHLTAFGDDGYLYVLDWAGAKLLGKLAHVRATSGGYYSDGRAPIYSRDGRILALATRVLQFVDLPTGKEIGPGVGHAESLTFVKFLPDGRQMQTKDSRTTHAWDASSGKHIGAVESKLPADAGSQTIISSDGKLAITVRRLGSAEAAFQAALAGEEMLPRDATLLDAATGKELAKLNLEPEPTAIFRKPLVFSPDSKLLAAVSGEAQQKIMLYEMPTGKKIRSLDGGPGVAPARKGKGLGAGFPGGGGFGGFLARMNVGQRVLFSPDARTLAFQFSPGAAILVFDVATGKPLPSPSAGQDTLVLQGAFTPDGRCLALEKNDGTTTLYELATGQPRRTYGHKQLVRASKSDGFDVGFGGYYTEPVPQERIRGSSAISPDGKLLACAGLNGAIHVCDVLTGVELAVLTGHTSGVTSMAFGSDGKTLASASHDTTALIWDMTRIARPASTAKSAKAGDLEAWWEALADIDAGKAIVALSDLVASPKEAVAWVKERVQPAVPLDLQRTHELLRQLDGESFQVRDKASRDLLKLGELLLPELDKALAGSPSAEKQRRLRELHAKLADPVLQGERLRQVRAVEALAWIGSSEARQVLQRLAGGAPGAIVTDSARSALTR